MLFKNEEASLQLDIVNYALSDWDGEDYGDDQNWLVLRATWINEDGEIVKDSNDCLLTYELTEMTAGLKVLNAGIRDCYESMFTDPYFTLSACADGEDHFQVYVSFYLPNIMEGEDTAELRTTMDKQQMTALIAELDRLCAKFPDRP